MAVIAEEQSHNAALRIAFYREPRGAGAAGIKK